MNQRSPACPACALYAVMLVLGSMLCIGCETLEPTPGPQPGGAAVDFGAFADSGFGGDAGGLLDPDAAPAEPEPDPGADAGPEEPPDPGIDGRLLYLRYCAVCHGADGTGGPSWPETIRGLTETWEVVHDGRGEMPAFPSLSPADVLAIERYLAEVPVDDPLTPEPEGEPEPEPEPELPPLTPAETYITTCAVCHGVQGDGTPRGPQIRFPVAGYARWVVRNGREGLGHTEAMPAYDAAALSDETLGAILDWLSSFERPQDGQGLYRAFCGNCHGPAGFGGWVSDSVRAESLDEYQEAIREGEGGQAYGRRDDYMPRWSPAELSDAEIRLIWLEITGGLPGEHSGEGSGSGSGGSEET